jgi:anti-sigma B factor antagonist
MATMELSTRVLDDHVVITVRGELDCVYAADAEAGMTALTAPGQTLIVDMSALGYMDCSSLGLLLRVRRLARQTGGDVVLAAPQRLPLRLLALTGKDKVFCVHPSVQAAAVCPGLSRKLAARCAAI